MHWSFEDARVPRSDVSKSSLAYSSSWSAPPADFSPRPRCQGSSVGPGWASSSGSAWS